MRVRTVLLSGLLALTACSDNIGREGTILPAGLRLSEGDVVFRRGGGFTSHAVLMADNGGVYSHVGIVADSAGQLVVIHAVPGEPDFEGDEDRVKMERPADFFARMRADRGAVYRPLDSIAALQAARRAVAIYRRHTLFDHDYDDSDTTALYCTELVVHAYSKTRRPMSGLSRHHLPLVGFEADCVLPSDILHCKDFKLITSF